MAETSNANLIKNADYLLASGKQDNSEIIWEGPSKQRYDSTKVLHYLLFQISANMHACQVWSWHTVQGLHEIQLMYWWANFCWSFVGDEI